MTKVIKEFILPKNFGEKNVAVIVTDSETTRSPYYISPFINFM